MYKDDVLAYMAKSKKIENKQGGNGAVNLLASILKVTPSTISQFKELIPARRSMQLERFFTHKDKYKDRKRYGFIDDDGELIEGAPVYDSDLYE